MKVYHWLLVTSGLAFAGCGQPPCVGATCQVKNCIPQCAAKLPPPTACGIDKCFAEIREPKVVDAPCVKAEPQVQEAFAMERKAVTKKVPVQTYRVVEEWVDATVLEPYTETVKVRMPKKLALREEKFGYRQRVGEVNIKLNVPKTTLETQEECRPVRLNDKIVRYEQCGCKEYLPITREGERVVHKCQKTTEKAVYTVTVPGYVTKPGITETIAKRDGYYTENFAVEKFREVPGKVLQSKRVCETVWVDKVEYEEVARPVERTLKLPVETTQKKIVYENKTVAVDCQTGARLPEADPQPADAAVKPEIVKGEVVVKLE